jgi:hypothetical protein
MPRVYYIQRLMTMPRTSSPLLLAVVVTFVVHGLAATAHARPEPPKLVPGTVGLTQKEVPLRNACTPTFNQIKKTRRGDDPAFVVAMTYPRITGLDMDPAKKARAKASLARFDRWFQDLMKTMDTATKAQHAILGDLAATPQIKVEAAARIALLLDQAALIIESAEVPRNVRAYPEAVEVFCDTLAEKTAPLREQARQARDQCGKVVADARLTAGWFLAVCEPPPPATQPTLPSGAPPSATP